MARPPANVEVADALDATRLAPVIVEVAVMFATLVISPEIKALPWTESLWLGVVVPMPTRSVIVFRVVNPPDDVKAPPPPEPAQVPSASSKQPPSNLMPFANVEVADVEVMFRALTSIPQAKVEVAVVEVATNIGALKLFQAVT